MCLDASIADAEELVSLLADLRKRVGAGGEGSLGALLVAVERTADEWRAQQLQVARATAELDAERAVEDAIRCRLRQMIELVRDLPPVPISVTESTTRPPPGPPSVASSPVEEGRSRIDLDAVRPGSASVGRPESAPCGPRRPGHAARATSPPTNGLAVTLFGPVRVHLDGVRIDAGLHGKALRVLHFLVAHDRPVPREVLIEQFWPESDIDTGRRALHQAIYTMRKAIRRQQTGAQVISFDRDAYSIDPARNVWRDVDEFEELFEAGKSAELAGDGRLAVRCYERAEALRVGEYLEEWLYEDWTAVERERLRLVYIELANRLGDLLEPRDVDAAHEMSHRVLAVDPCDEQSNLRIMRCHAAGGHRHLAIRHFRSYAEDLDRTYGLGPSPESLALFKSLTR